MSNIDPSSARTAEDFVMLLRQARAMSELTFWQLEKAANAAGHELEPTVLAETLGLATLPDEPLVTALLAACGYPPDRIDHWLAVRDRLASAALSAPDLPAGSPGQALRPGSPATPAQDSAPGFPPASAHDSVPGFPPGFPATPAHDSGPASAHDSTSGSALGSADQSSRLSFPAAAEPAWVPLLAPGPAPDPAPGSPPRWTPTGGQHDARPHDAGPHDATASLPEIAAPAAARARHTLRIPGRGTRRAPGSWLRPLFMAAAALVVLAGGIAVIVSAINNGEGDGPPVYATGAPPAPAPQLSESAPAETTATPSSTTSPSHTASPASEPPALAGILRNGTATLQNGQSIDLDGGGSGPDIVVFGDGDGVRSGPSDRHFALEPTATKQACASTNGYQKTLQNLTAGNGICVRTDQGRYAHITIARTGPLGFSYVVWS